MYPLEFLHPRDELLHAMERIYRHRMTTTSGGNLSIRESSGDVWITPARVDKGTLRRTDIVCVRANGSVDGWHRPSSELPFHQAIYRARPDLNAIVHAHPVALVAFSMLRRTPETRLFPQAWHVCGTVGFAPYALPGSEQLGNNIAQVFAEGPNCVVLENHGVVVAGRTLSEAFQRFEALEFVAKTQIKSAPLGPYRSLSPEQLEVAERRRPFGQERLTGARELTGEPTRRARPPGLPALSSREKELRRQLCEFVHRGCRQRLLISTEGSLSARLEGSAFLITPSQQDRYTLDLDGLVLVNGDHCESGKQPSRATRAHQLIYDRHPEVQAIALAHPVNATAFSVTDTELDARTIPESYLFLREVPRLAYGVQYQPHPILAERVSIRSPVALLANDGVLVLGTSVLDVFDRLEVLESTAESLINARLLGEPLPMSEAVIDELRNAFFPDSA